MSSEKYKYKAGKAKAKITNQAEALMYSRHFDEYEDEDYHLKRCLLVLSGAGCAKVNDWDMKIARQHHGHTSQ